MLISNYFVVDSGICFAGNAFLPFRINLVTWVTTLLWLSN